MLSDDDDSSGAGPFVEVRHDESIETSSNAAVMHISADDKGVRFLDMVFIPFNFQSDIVR